MLSHNGLKEINFLLIGLAGVGKSSLINLICNENKALVKGYKDKGFRGVTKLIEKYTKIINNVKMNFYDTPGFGDLEVSVDDFIQQIDDFKKEELTIDYIIYVNKSDSVRVLDYLKICFDVMKIFFGENLSSNVICVLTHFKNFKNSLEDINKLEIEKQIYISEFLDTLKYMNFLIYEKNVFFSDITNPEKGDFVKHFSKFVNVDLHPLKFKSTFDEKELEKTLNKYMEKNKDLFGIPERLNIEEYRKLMNEEKKIILNGCLIGKTNTGKTSLFNYYFKKMKNIKFPVTTGLDMNTTYYKESDKIYKFTLHDTPGQEPFKSYLPSVIKKSDIIFIVYDFEDLVLNNSINSSLQIFESQYIIKFLEDYSPKDSKIIILCNKIDLKEKHREKIIMDDIERKIKKLQETFKKKLNNNEEILHYFVSSHTDENSIDKIMEKIISQFSNKIMERESERIILVKKDKNNKDESFFRRGYRAIRNLCGN